MGRVPVLTLCSLDPALRDSAIGIIICDFPGALVVRHELLPEAALLHRMVFDRDGVLEDEWHPLTRACLSCALREDIVPTVERLARTQRPDLLILALPATAEPLPVVRAFVGNEPVQLGRLVSVIDGDHLERDLLGDDLLIERGLGLHPDEDRAVGETLAQQLEMTDLVLSPTRLDGRSATLVAHLVTAEQATLQDVDAERLLADPRTIPVSHRAALLDVASTGAPPAHGIWTLDLQSWRPLHPGRLLENVERLGTWPIRARGRFWVPTRPGRLCAWDGAGGQLSLGDAGAWTRPPDTRIVVTGTERDPSELIIAFDSALLTDSELARGLASWKGGPDGLDLWLGGRPEAA